MLHELKYCNLGLMKFQKAFEIQQRLHTSCATDLIGPVVLLVEHPRVLTLGKNASVEFITATNQDLEESGTEVVRIDRGGEVTAHMPGQLVAYPIIKLSSRHLGPKAYVEGLESAIIALLNRYKIEGHTDPINSGVWVNRQKICAVGIRISRRTTLHGLALNVNNDLDLFDAIVPCGIRGRTVTNMKALTGEMTDLRVLRGNFMDCFSKIFGYQSVTELSVEDLEAVLTME
jgi:lipoate-protein ligase B